LTPNESSLAGHIYLLQNPTTVANDLSGFHINKTGNLVEKQDAEITDLWGFNLRCHCFAISTAQEDIAIVNINCP
jgi:hypothetical protein